jgi:hypothetical protein
MWITKGEAKDKGKGERGGGGGLGNNSCDHKTFLLWTI